MQATFTAQILADKLAKLNSTQQSIETLSHWCIFHRRSAKQVVDIWKREFFRAPREQRVPFLYLANDILQNSRRKGAEFVTEFWRVLAGALKDVVKNGDDHNRSTVLRLIDIWEERRVFGSHAQGLRNELLGKEPSPNNTEGPLPEKLVSVYETFHDKLVDEEALIDKCNAAVCNLEAFEKEIDLSSVSGQENIMIEELQHQEGVLLECGQLLEAAELAHSSIVFQLRETLRDQEEKLERTRLLLQAAHSHAEQARMMQQQIFDAAQQQHPSSGDGSDEEGLLARFDPQLPLGSSSPAMLFTSGGGGEAESYVPTEASKLFDPASVAAKLVASTSSAAMISSMLSSLAAENLVTKLTQQHEQESKPAEAEKPAGDEGDEAAAREPGAKRQKVIGDDEQSPLAEDVEVAAAGEMLAATSDHPAAATVAAAATSSSAAATAYLDTSMLFNFAAGQFALPVTSTSSAAPPPGCAPADYQQTTSAFFAAPSEKFV